MPSASRRRILDPFGTLLLLLLLGLALRLFVAFVLLPQSGLRNDMSSFAAWALRMADLGPGGFYEAGVFADYPPAYMYVLWLLGEVSRFFEPILGGASPIRPLIKVPGMVADMGVATLIYLVGVRFLGEHPSTRWLGSGARIGLIGAAVYLFNPGTVFNSAVWGQMDSVGRVRPAGRHLLPGTGLDRGRRRSRGAGRPHQVPARLAHPDRAGGGAQAPPVRTLIGARAGVADRTRSGS